MQNPLIFFPENTEPAPQTQIDCTGIKFDFLKNSKAELSVTGPTIPENSIKKRGRKPKESSIVKADGGSEIVVNETISTYDETNMLLKQTLNEVDSLSLELKTELDSVRSSKTLRNRFGYIADLSENIGSLLGTKIQIIKELNNSITKSNDMDYKRQKDMNALAAQDSDQQIFDMYSAFINTPVTMANTNGSAILGPDTRQMTLMGNDNIIRADRGGLDAAFQNFTNNMTPSQKLMVMEDDVHDVLVYDQATGNKYFDKVDRNGNSIPGIERRDAMFLGDYTIDTRNKIARNVNLNDVMPVVIINENKKFDEY